MMVCTSWDEATKMAVFETCSSIFFRFTKFSGILFSPKRIKIIGTYIEMKVPMLLNAVWFCDLAKLLVGWFGLRLRCGICFILFRKGS
jgi:hypothetical protein